MVNCSMGGFIFISEIYFQKKKQNCSLIWWRRKFLFLLNFDSACFNFLCCKRACVCAVCKSVLYTIDYGLFFILDVWFVWMPVDEQSRAIFNYMTIRPTFYRFIFFDCRLSGFKQINNKIEKKLILLPYFYWKDYTPDYPTCIINL